MTLKERFIKDIDKTIEDDNARRQIQYRWVLKILIAFITVMTVINIIQQRYSHAVVIFLVALTFFGLYWVVYILKDKSLPIVATIMNIVMFFIITYLMMFNDNSNTAIWTLLVPPLSILLTGVKFGTISSIVMLFELMFFFYVPFGNNLLNHRYPQNVMIVLPVVYVLLTVITVFFEMLRIVTLDSLRESREKSKQIYRHNYYEMRDRIKEAKRARHDMRHHYVMIQTLLSENKTQELSDYVSGLYSSLPFEESLSYCECYDINALLTYFSQQCKNYNINYTVDVSYPAELPFEDFDLTIVFGNLLENAVEACNRDFPADGGERPNIEVQGEYKGGCLILSISNDTSAQLNLNDGKLMSSKRSEFGIGVESVKASAQKYGGDVRISLQNGRFNVLVTMLNTEQEKV